MTTTGTMKPATSHSTHSEHPLGGGGGGGPDSALNIPPLPRTASSPPPPSDRPYPSPASRPGGGGGGSRTISKGGGAQVTLDETGSWSDLNSANGGGGGDRDGRGGLSGGPGSGKSKPNGMLGFLSRKKGRERSPKPMEAGVLGKEGARVVVGGR